MVVPSTANGFRATVSALRSLDGGGCEFPHFTPPEDRFARLLVKNLGSGMHESVVREELESLDIRVQGVKQLSSGRREQDPAQDRHLTPHFIVSVARGQTCPRCVLSKSSADCECRWRRTWPQKDQCNASAASASNTRSVTADTRHGASRVGTPTSPVGALPRGNSLSAVAAGATTRRTTGAVLSGKKRRQPLQSKRPSVYERAPAQATSPFLNFSRPGPLPSR